MRLLMFSLVALFLLTATPFLTTSGTQNVDPQKFQHAIIRSADAGKILTLLAAAPDGTIPKEILNRAEAIGVFPKVNKDTIVFTETTNGYGVISARTTTGWTMPAFYRFGGGGYTSPFGDSESYALILVFLTKDSLKWFEKGGVVLGKDKKAIEGPIGTLSDEQRKAVVEQPMLAYAYFNGKLSGKGFNSRFWKAFALNPDNNINTPLYGMKGREVLAGANLDTAKVLQGISAYQDTLIQYYSR